MSSVEAQLNEPSAKRPQEKYRCCCRALHVKNGTYVVAYVSAFFIVSNFFAKIAGYSETAWDWELLFLIVDSVAVASLIYGLYSERAAFLQPFVALSIITTSFLILLGAYLGSAAFDPSSHAGQDLELELHKRLSDAAHHLSVEFKSMVSIVAIVGFFGILVSLFLHCWFVYLAVQCAKYFRELDVAKQTKQQYGHVASKSSFGGSDDGSEEISV